MSNCLERKSRFVERPNCALPSQLNRVSVPMTDDKDDTPSMLRRHAFVVGAIGLLAICPTVFRFDAPSECWLLPFLLLAALVGLVYFAMLLAFAAFRRELRAAIVGIVGLGLSVLPLTSPGLYLSRYCYFWRVQSPYAEQVELARSGHQTAERVAGAKVEVTLDPFRVIFHRPALLFMDVGVVYSPSGNVDFDLRMRQTVYHLQGPWYWCFWE